MEQTTLAMMGPNRKNEHILMSTANPNHYGMRISQQNLGAWVNL